MIIRTGGWTTDDLEQAMDELVAVGSVFQIGEVVYSPKQFYRARRRAADPVSFDADAQRERAQAVERVKARRKHRNFR